MSDCCDIFRFTDPGDGFSVGEGGQGPAGKSAYQAAVEAGFTGTEEEFNEYLSGIGDLTDEVAQQKSLLNQKAGILRDTASGAIASFVPDSTIDNLLGVSVAVEPVQDLHGYGSPWPGGGGKNKLAPLSPTSGTESGITYTVYNDGTIKLNGTATANFTLYFVGGNDVYDDAGIATGSYKIGGSTTNTYIYVAEEGGIPIGAGNGQEVSVTMDSTKNYRIFVRVSSGDTVNNVIVKPMISINGGEYAPYSNICPIFGRNAVSIWNKPTHDTMADPTVTIQLGRTVYGCNLAIAEDESVTALIDRAAVDLGTVSWTYYTTVTPPVFYGDLPNGKGVSSGEATALSICSYYPLALSTAVSANVFASSAPDMSIAQNGRTASCRMFVKDTQYTSESALATALSGQKVVYELATPVEITLDPLTISTISGQTNNVWADAGDVTVEYAADIKAYIDRLNQSPEDDMIANSLIAANKYFTVNNRLFLSTASIAAGAMIIPGTNCTETSLVEALNALNS